MQKLWLRAWRIGLCRPTALLDEPRRYVCTKNPPGRKYLVNLSKRNQMDIQTSKIELVKIILNIDNDHFIKKVTDFINNEKSDFWNGLSTAEQEKIKLGIDQLNKGQRTTYKEVLKTIS